MLQNIPHELRALDQWLVASSDKIPRSEHLRKADVNNVKDYMSFDTAVRVAALSADMCVGFVLTDKDPFTCIDLDVKDYENWPDDPTVWTTSDQYDLFYRMMLAFGSYTESSRSGKGLHIWVLGDAGPGKRSRNGVEVYSQQRFMICTGNVVQNKPIIDRNEMLTNMLSQMSQEQKSLTNLKEIADTSEDWQVLQMCNDAENGSKFRMLWNMDFEMGPGKEYPSQSEADLALLSMFCFYTTSNVQCKRLFRQSKLGQRPKATKDSRYLDRTLKLIRGRQEHASLVDFSSIVEQAKLVLDQRHILAMEELERIQSTSRIAKSVKSLHNVDLEEPEPSIGPVEARAAMSGPSGGPDVLDAEGLEWPPGLAGRIAQFIYKSAPRPVKEVAIVATLGLLSGICGKAWHIPQSGLNGYFILVAKSAIGKEAMHSGIAAIMNTCRPLMPSFTEFVDFTEFVSGPALFKAVAANPSFVNITGEWGHKLRRMQDTRDTGMATLRTQMTNLYQKSGPGSYVGGMGYSDIEKNISSTSSGLAYSMIGETTPGTFYESLTSNMMEDGFLSRFLVIEYDGDRPAMNLNQQLTPDAALQDALLRLAYQAQQLLARDHSQALTRTDEVGLIMRNFEHECDERINETQDESRRQMWNRAALKATRIAGVLAVADNWVNPVITKEHIEWGIMVVRRNIKIILTRLRTGDIGLGDNSRDLKLMSLLRAYVYVMPSKSYKNITTKMWELRVFPRSWIQIITQSQSVFYKHPQGANQALDLALKNAEINGWISEIPRAQMKSAFDFSGRCYQILDLPDEEA